jgi:hypothetical protein
MDGPVDIVDEHGPSKNSIHRRRICHAGLGDHLETPQSVDEIPIEGLTLNLRVSM